MDKDEAQAYLTSLLNKHLRILSTDGRTFRGLFKCVDPDANLVIAQTYEYRPCSGDQLPEADGDSGASSAEPAPPGMTSRYLGLVVVPGHHIIKMEVEEFASQLKDRVNV